MAELYNRVMSDRDHHSKQRRSKVLEPELLTPAGAHADEAGPDDLTREFYKQGRSRRPVQPNRRTTTQRGRDQQ